MVNGFFFILSFFSLSILGVPWLLFSLLFSIFFLEMAIKYHVTPLFAYPEGQFWYFLADAVRFTEFNILAGNGRHLENGFFSPILNAMLFTHLRPFALLARMIHRSSQTPFPFVFMAEWVTRKKLLQKMSCNSVCTNGFLGSHFMEEGFYRKEQLPWFSVAVVWSGRQISLRSG